jgi:hypothetical protein
MTMTRRKEATGQSPAACDASALPVALFESGRIPYPISPATGHPVVNIDQWASELSLENIRNYWQAHPDHLCDVVDRTTQHHLRCGRSR